MTIIANNSQHGCTSACRAAAAPAPAFFSAPAALKAVSLLDIVAGCRCCHWCPALPQLLHVACSCSSACALHLAHSKWQQAGNELQIPTAVRGRMAWLRSIIDVQMESGGMSRTAYGTATSVLLGRDAHVYTNTKGAQQLRWLVQSKSCEH
jgi:hypothetical protein